jgi:hypothetical protein
MSAAVNWAVAKSSGGAEEPGELAEHQAPVPLRHQVSGQLGEHVELGRRNAMLVRVDEVDVEAGRRSSVNDRRISNRFRSNSPSRPSTFWRSPLQIGLVRSSMLAIELQLDDLLLLGGQLGGHVGLPAAQQQRADPAAQLGQPVGVAVLLDRVAVVLGGLGGRGRFPPGWFG